MSQFSLKWLFASTAIAAFGMAMLVSSQHYYHGQLDLLSVVMAGACFGAAAFTPFNRPFRGAAIGGVLGVIASLALEANSGLRY